MPRANRPTPTGQMSLFQVHQDAKRQNNRWIVSGTATVGQLLAATEREPEEHYGIQTAVQRPLHPGHCLDLARYFKATSNWIIEVIAHLLPAEIAPLSHPPGDQSMTTVDNYQVHCRRRAGRPEKAPCRR